jgi:transketolase
VTVTPTKQSLEELCINTIRTLSIDAVQKANSGHPGAPMGLAPLAYTLFTRVMRHNPSNPDWFDRDRFILSAGHASMLLYSMLYLTGYPMRLDDIEHFRQVGSPTAGHPERKYSPGIEATTGPLGQGISMAVGIALAEHMLEARLNEPGHEIIDHYTFTIASDGDLQEGVASEASSLAGHLGLGKLIAFFDNNHVQLASATSAVISEDVRKRYEAYGWHVEDVGEDLSPDNLERATREAMAITDRPSLIMVRSHIGYGSPNKQDTSGAHGSPLGEDEVRLTKEAYGWDPDKHFYVPDEALAHFRESCDRGQQFESEWNERFAAYKQANPDKAELLLQFAEARLPDGCPGSILTTSRSRPARRPRPSSSGRPRRCRNSLAARRTSPAPPTPTSTKAVMSRRINTTAATFVSAFASTRWERSSTGSTFTASAPSVPPS